MMARRYVTGWLLLAALAAVSGCDLWEGRPIRPAAYKLPKDKRVLVLVDVDPGLSPPPTYATNMADRIATALFSHKAADTLVPQAQALALQQKDPSQKISTAEIARETGADVVVLVRLWYLKTPKTADNLVAWGDAQAYVRVVDRNGNLLWPGRAPGATVAAHVPEAEVSVRDVPRIFQDLSDQLAKSIGRIFYDWQAESGEPPVRAL
jgi:hypothetical protein